MMSISRYGFLAAILIFTACGAQRVLALAGTLERPSLAFPSSMDPARREAVMKVLNQHPEEFQGGEFINASTTLRYKGPVESLNRFLAGLATCAGLRIQVTFARDQEGDWQVRHNGWDDPDRIQVILHTGAQDFRIEDLALPEIRGTPSQP